MECSYKKSECHHVREFCTMIIDVGARNISLEVLLYF